MYISSLATNYGPELLKIIMNFFFFLMLAYSYVRVFLFADPNVFSVTNYDTLKCSLRDQIHCNCTGHHRVFDINRIVQCCNKWHQYPMEWKWQLH